MSPAVFAHGQLRLYLLRLLADRPMHGYEVIQALSDQSGGTYSPSAGTIYPRLGKLEEEGLVTKEVDGRKTIYAITDAGRAELAEREPELEGIESEFTDSVRRLADEVRASVTDAMRTLRADLAAAAREARTEAEQFGVTPKDERAAARARVREADAALSAFRAEMGTELRATLADGRDPEPAVRLLVEGMRDLQRQVIAALRG